MLTLHLLAREGKYDEAADKIGELIQLMDRFEPNNHTLYYDTSLPFARMVSCLDRSGLGSFLQLLVVFFRVEKRA